MRNCILFDILAIADSRRVNLLSRRITHYLCLSVFFYKREFVSARAMCSKSSAIRARTKSAHEQRLDYPRASVFAWPTRSAPNTDQNE